MFDFLNNIKENLTNKGENSDFSNSIDNFIEELTEKLAENNNNQVDIVSKITSENNMTLRSENGIIKARNNALKEYAESKGETIYFILNKIPGTDDYRVMKIEENTTKTTNVNKNELPEGAELNQVLRIQDGQYQIDMEGTKIIQNEIYQKAEEIIEEQNNEIEEYKKEGHIYIVTEDTNNRIFLWDTTEKPDKEIEEINFPEDLLNIAKEGAKFIYENGTYKEYEE